MCRVYTKNMIDFLQLKQESLSGVEPFFVHTTVAHRSLPSISPQSKLVVAELGPVELADIGIEWQATYA